MTLQASGPEPSQTPPFLILFVNSICNLTCEHCFYWRSLNSRDDLTLDEIRALSHDLGPVENLNLSGGEPFLRKEFADICLQFIEHNQTRQIYVPTNGYFTDRTDAALQRVLENKDLWFFVCELSLDGMPEYHDRFRGNNKSFAKAMETYDRLAELQARDPRLRIHAISTATADNLGEIRQLTKDLYDRCPKMDHHNLALIRGDRKNPSLQGPLLAEDLRPDRVPPRRVGPPRARPVRRQRRAAAALGQGPHRAAAAAGRAMPRRPAHRRGLRQRRRQRL